MAENTGWGKLGNALVGFDTSEAYREGAREAVDVESALMRARKQRDELNALDEVRAAMEDMPPQEQAIANMLLGGLNPNSFTSAQEDQQKMGFRDRAVTAAGTGDTDAANALLAAISGRRIESPDLERARIDTERARAERLRQAPAPRAGRSAPTRVPQDETKKLLVQSTIRRYERLMAREGADIAALESQRDKELARLGVGPSIAPDSSPAERALLGDLNNLPPGATIDEEAAAAQRPGVGVERIEARKTYQGKSYVKINGSWYEE